MNKSSTIKLIKLIALALVWLTFDRIAKSIILAIDITGQTVRSDSWLGIFHICFVKNTGAAFGSFSGGGIVLTVISAVLVVMLVVFFIYCLFAEQNSRLPFSVNACIIIPVALIIAGGISNMYDRIAYGYVIDYICPDFISFPVFNIADIGVTCGAIFLVIYLIIVMVKDSSHNNNDSISEE